MYVCGRAPLKHAREGVAPASKRRGLGNEVMYKNFPTVWA